MNMYMFLLQTTKYLKSANFFIYLTKYSFTLRNLFNSSLPSSSWAFIIPSAHSMLPKFKHHGYLQKMYLAFPFIRKKNQDYVTVV